MTALDHFFQGLKYYPWTVVLLNFDPKNQNLIGRFFGWKQFIWSADRHYLGWIDIKNKYT